MLPNRTDAFTKSPVFKAAWFLARLAMAGIFIYASIDKIGQPAVFAKDIYNYQILPDSLINLTALVLPWLELFLGLCLLAGIWLPGAVLAMNGLLVVFLAALLFNTARGLDINCGCFSTGAEAAAMSTTYYLIRDIAFLLIGAFLFVGVFLLGIGRSKAPQAPTAGIQKMENAS